MISRLIHKSNNDGRIINHLSLEIGSHVHKCITNINLHIPRPFWRGSWDLGALGRSLVFGFSRQAHTTHYAQQQNNSPSRASCAVMMSATLSTIQQPGSQGGRWGPRENSSTQRNYTNDVSPISPDFSERRNVGQFELQPLLIPQVTQNGAQVVNVETRVMT